MVISLSFGPPPPLVGVRERVPQRFVRLFLVGEPLERKITQRNQLQKKRSAAPDVAERERAIDLRVMATECLLLRSDFSPAKATMLSALRTPNAERRRAQLSSASAARIRVFFSL